MRTVTLVRKWLTERSTIGILSFEGFTCYTLEDRSRAPGVKVYGETAIPPGTYPVLITTSARFKRPMPLLVNVPMFTGIRIHSGNTPENTEGCILLGSSFGVDVVYESRKAFNVFFSMLEEAVKSDTVQIVITEDPVLDTRNTA